MTATADNCLLTCYPFLARNTTEHHIVVEQVTDRHSTQHVIDSQLTSANS